MTTPEVGPDILEAGKTHKRTELSRQAEVPDAYKVVPTKGELVV